MKSTAKEQAKSKALELIKSNEFILLTKDESVISGFSRDEMLALMERIKFHLLFEGRQRELVDYYSAKQFAEMLEIAKIENESEDCNSSMR